VLDALNHQTVWYCEKWSEEAVDFARRKLEHAGIDMIPGELRPVLHLDREGRFSQILVPRLMPIKEGISSAVLRSVVGPAEECTEIVGNLLLNEGIQRLQDLTMIATVVSNQVATNPWSNANSYLGVGGSNKAEAATQTELSAASNRWYNAMNATYPSRSSQTVSFQSDFTTAQANYAWAEWTVSAGATSPGSLGSNGTTNLNRKVAALGTKASGTWTLTAQITFS